MHHKYCEERYAESLIEMIACDAELLELVSINTEVKVIEFINTFFYIGEVEGPLGVIRLLGVLPRYQGLCIGNRLLKRTEKAMHSQGCIRSMVCVPSPRHSMSNWIQRRGRRTNLNFCCTHTSHYHFILFILVLVMKTANFPNFRMARLILCITHIYFLRK